MSESTNKLAEDTNRFTLRVIKKGTAHVEIDEALTVGWQGTETIELGEIGAATFYPVVIVSWDGTDSAPDPDLIQYFTNPRLEWDTNGNVNKMCNWSIESSGTLPNKLRLKIRAYQRDAPNFDERFYYTICSLEAGPQALGDEAAWKFN